MTAPSSAAVAGSAGAPEGRREAVTPLDPPYRLAGRRVWVAGHRGMVGAALMRRLAREECTLLTCARDEVDLRMQAPTLAWVRQAQPEVVIVAAATVGGIHANESRPATFLYDNLAIATNVIEAARIGGVSKLLFLGSSCIYPRLAPQPIAESALLTGPLEPTNQWYAIAKIAGIKLCQAYRMQHGCDFISAQPTNLYGPGDSFDLATSHVVPALMRKIDLAMRRGDDRVVIWGTGRPRREFLYVDDLADALVYLLEHYSGATPINVGTGTDITIRALAEMIAEIAGYSGSFRYDDRMPDGAPRKLLNVERLNSLGWRPTTPLDDGLRKTYQWYCQSGLGHLPADVDQREGVRR